MMRLFVWGLFLKLYFARAMAYLCTFSYIGEGFVLSGFRQLKLAFFKPSWFVSV